MDEFTRWYIKTALWCGIDEDYDLDQSQLAPETLARMESDCREFQAKFAEVIAQADETGLCRRGPDCDSALARAGHDFWLTRNGHGAGFWDGDWPEPWASQLDSGSKAFSSCELYMGDDGLIYS